ncbi:hypothetical protein JK167_11800 [Levilactobacillus brevis]|uniref:Uncharacterized protein n=1 Tax=Levilactobacillus brevis TaxID=1580 RepID=A0AA41ERF4_LEVBR|nr:hypothetical protein [Levilactobacillus brevis]MBS0948360.1 hypothetical protein [Levilactobacillus brevis]MBS1011505.1 hypothetical protein [Levilactobacillus brevis]
MKHGDKVYYHPRHHVKQPATWLCWITRGDRRVAMVKVKGSHVTIEISPRYVDIGIEKEVYKYGQ